MRPVTRSLFRSARGRARVTAKSLLAVALLALSAAACAASFTVNPVRIELSESSPTAVLQVENTQCSPVTLQLSPMAWSQPDGKDVLTPSRDIIASPQIFSLKPGATQLVRIGWLRRPDADTERPYRLLVEEIPAPPPTDFKGLQVALRISLPVILKPAGATVAKLSATVVHDRQQQLRVQLTNRGNAVAHLYGLSVHAAGGTQAKLAAYPSVYVLPGQQRELAFLLPEAMPDSALLIKATMQGNAMELHAGSADR